ncbi:MAG: oligopeptide/dipeptide ABC transporter ATP-binding protein [Desulfitobacteriaceae bacterium]
MVEEGVAESILQKPHHPYTRSLIAAVPNREEAGRSGPILVRGELPSPQKFQKAVHFTLAVNTLRNYVITKYRNYSMLKKTAKRNIAQPFSILLVHNEMCL